MGAVIFGYKIYGKNSALSVELTSTRASDRFPKGAPTISFEMADFDNSKSADGADWTNKLIVQVTLKELPQVIAVLSGHAEVAEFKYHGSNRNKSYKLTPTLLSLSTAGKSHSVALKPNDRFEICSLCMKQLQRSHGSMSSGVIYRMIADCYRD